jgi:flagellar L-ring protein precursor FlgH
MRLDGAGATLDSAAVTLDGAGATLDSAAVTLDGAGATLDRAAVTLDGAGATLNGASVWFGRGAVAGRGPRTVLCGVLLGLQAACGLLPSMHHKPDPVIARVLPPPTPRTEGAIYQTGQQMELFVDLKAHRVGDLLTITLNEITAASKNATTTTAKTTTVANSAPTVLGQSLTLKGAPILSTTLSGADAFNGTGTSTQGNSLAGSLTVTVVEVQPNGNLVVQGDKTLKLNQGDEYVHISGVVRVPDIAANNTVTSDKLADARISYWGKGVIDSSNRMGWLARFFNSPYFPF